MMMEDLEARFQRLRSRREVLEQKIELKSSTLSGFSVLREEKLCKTISAVTEQNAEARQRNNAILREIGAQLYQCNKACADIENRSKSSPYFRLREARLMYIRSIESLLPVLQAATTNRRLEKIQELRDKKEKAVQRRELRKQYESRDQEVRSLLEQERREYMLQLSLQQRDVLDATEREILSRQQSKATDEVIMEAIQRDLTSREKAISVYFSSVVENEKVEEEEERFVQRLDVKAPSILTEVIASEPADTVPASFSAATIISKKNQQSDAGLSLNKSTVLNNAPPISTEQSSPARETAPLLFQSNSSPAVPPQVPHEILLRTSATSSPAKTNPDPIISSSSLQASVGGTVTEPSLALNWLTEHMSLYDCAKVLKVSFDFLENLPGKGTNSDLSCAYKGADVETLLLSTASALVESVCKSGSLQGSPDTVASTSLVILSETGFQLFPKEALNGVVTLEKLQKVLKKLGGGRLEVLNSITDHLSSAVEKNKAEPEELANIFTSRLIHFLEEDGERTRVERKVQKLLQLAALTPKAGSKSPVRLNTQDNVLGFITTSSDFVPEKAQAVPTIGLKRDVSRSKVLLNSSISNRSGITDEFEDLDDIDVIGKPPPVRDLAQENGEDF